MESLAAGLDVEAHQLFLFTVRGELSEERVTEVKIRDLLKQSDAGQKRLMWRVLQGIAASEA